MPNLALEEVRHLEYANMWIGPKQVTYALIKCPGTFYLVTLNISGMLLVLAFTYVGVHGHR